MKTSFSRAATLMALSVIWLGCPTTPPASNDGGADADVPCDGLIGCACVNGACQAGECVGAVCTDCKRGELACICRTNSTCNAGLRCGAGTLCEACPAGSDGCACGPGDACGAGLKCSAGTCAPDTCVAGATGCPCRTGGTACEGTAYCDGMQLCQSCTPEVVGCPCGAGNACLSGLTCDTGTTTCRAARTCADLATDGTCLPHQACVEGLGADATCTPRACEAGFKWYPPSGACVACASTGCVDEPLCTSADAGLASACDALHRDCTVDGLSAWCSDCKSGFTPTGADAGVTACQPSPLCGAVSCTFDKFCDLSTGTPTCTALPCPQGQAKPAAGGACQSCGTKSCTGPGTTGRLWPVLGAGDVCICETIAGYFSPHGRSGEIISCDVDQDGWVNNLANPEAFQSDPAGLANMRCDIRRVDRVRLRDEYLVEVEVVSCANGLELAPDAGSCGAPVLMSLLESEENDLPGQRELNGAVGFPVYGPPGEGRFLTAPELNGLSKACVTLNGDFDKDGVEDIAQVQLANPGNNGQDRLHSFAYFVELADSWYVPGAAAGAPGALVIAERSRCDVGFPLRYAITDGGVPQAPEAYAPSDGSTYWRSCARRRDPDFNSGIPAPNMDFGKYTCSTTSPTALCASVFPAHPTMVGPVDPANGLMRHHGLCELGGALPKDGLWRGLLHHSQFKCVSITDSPSVPPKPIERGTSEFAVVGGTTVDKYVYNACAATPCSGPTDPACRTALGSGVQSRRPTITCRATPAVGGLVGFAAVGYRPYGNNTDLSTYRGGCLREDYETAANTPLSPSYRSWLCPFPEYNINDTKAAASFGRFSCYGDLPNFLWGEQGATPVPRATLRWGTGPADTFNGFFR